MSCGRLLVLRLPMSKKKTKPDPLAAELGARGGKARAKKLTPKERSEAARKAAQVRWAKKDEVQA